MHLRDIHFRALNRWPIRILVVALTVFAIIAHRFSPTQPTVLFDAFAHSLHAPGFAAVALAVLFMLRKSHPGLSAYILAALSASGISVLAEAAQIPGPRDAQISDLVIDATGIVGALGIVAAFDPLVKDVLSKVQRIMIAAFSVVALAVAFLPSAWYGYSIFSQHRLMPQLLTFEHAWESVAYWQTKDHSPELIDAPHGWPAAGGSVALATESGHDGILIRINPYPDWSGFSALSFVAASNSRSVHKLAIVIKDIRPRGNRSSNRYRNEFYVGPNPTRHVLNIADLQTLNSGRPFDLSHVHTIILSAAKPGNDVSVLIDDFRLQ